MAEEAIFTLGWSGSGLRVKGQVGVRVKGLGLG